MSSDPDPLAPDADDEPTPCAYTEYVPGDPLEAYPKTGEDTEGVVRDVWDALYGIEDPEMPVSIVDLGLIYGVAVDAGHATVTMTLTYSGCPARKYLIEDVESRVGEVEGVDSVDVELAWNPPWTLELVTEAGKEDLREFGLSVE